MLRGPLPHAVDTGTSPEQSSQCSDQRTPGEHSGVPRSIHNCRTVQLLLLLGVVYQSLPSLTSKFSFVALPSPFSSLPLQRHPLKSKKRARTPLKSRTRAKPPTKTGATADPSRVLLHQGKDPRYIQEWGGKKQFVCCHGHNFSHIVGDGGSFWTGSEELYTPCYLCEDVVREVLQTLTRIAWTRELSNFYFVLQKFHELFTIGMRVRFIRTQEMFFIIAGCTHAVYHKTLKLALTGGVRMVTTRVKQPAVI